LVLGVVWELVWLTGGVVLLRRSWKARAGGEVEEGGKEGKKER